MSTRKNARIQTRLTLTTLVVLLTGMILVAALAWIAVGRLYLDTQRENLLAQAVLTADALQGAALSDFQPEPYSQALNTAPGIHIRLISDQGAVVVSLPLPEGLAAVQVPPVENSAAVTPAELFQRPEIQQARLGVPATAIRRVAAAGNRRVLYAAAPILAADGSVAGLVYLATPLPAGGLPAGLLLQLGGALLLAILLASLAGGILSRRIARPLERVARSAGAVAAGDLEQRVPVDTAIRELDSLGQAFNAMTASLGQAEQAKNAFLADVTHELRTPLTVILGTLETLEDGAMDDLEGRGPLLDSMQKETERLIRLVNELLVLARADAGALKLDLQELDLGDMVRSRCEVLSRLAGLRQVELHPLSQAGCRVNTDPDRLAQVLDNLLDNAIRHAPGGSTVTVTIQPDGGDVRCAVRDSGKGIPAEHLPFIFERFYRADASRNRQTGGTGLGLAIVRALVLAQGGRVRADSVEGQGATVTFWLPAASELPGN
jgi:two-component system, OmpR family, sensor histidine kinase BaeS